MRSIFVKELVTLSASKGRKSKWVKLWDSSLIVSRKVSLGLIKFKFREVFFSTPRNFIFVIMRTNVLKVSPIASFGFSKDRQSIDKKSILYKTENFFSSSHSLKVFKIL